MGGPGSNRWLDHRRKPLAEESLPLDLEGLVGRLRRSPETASRLRWSMGDQVIAEVLVGVELDLSTLPRSRSPSQTVVGATRGGSSSDSS